MDIGIFLCQRGTADGKGDLLAIGAEKFNAEMTKRIEHTDGLKCISI
jgi:hypothetical protein